LPTIPRSRSSSENTYASYYLLTVDSQQNRGWAEVSPSQMDRSSREVDILRDVIGGDDYQSFRHYCQLCCGAAEAGMKDVEER
jgi:hypothetical protein